MRSDAHSIGPLTSFYRVADRHRGRGIVYFEIGRIQVLHVFELLDDLSRVFVASTLQIGIHQIIHGMELFSSVGLLMGRFPCREVGSDGIVPQAESREDMRWHVQSVRR